MSDRDGRFKDEMIDTLQSKNEELTHVIQGLKDKLDKANYAGLISKVGMEELERDKKSLERKIQAHEYQTEMS